MITNKQVITGTVNSNESINATVDDEKGISGDIRYTVLKGAKGDPGYTPIKGVDYFDGEKGDPGYTPVKGVDYFDGPKGDPGDDYVLTSADKAEIAGLVLDALPVAESEGF